MRGALLALTVSLVALVGAPASAATTRSVSAGDNFFSPSTSAIARGDSVKWTNVSGFVSHTTTDSTPLRLWNATLRPGGTFTRPFVAAGGYPYRCTFHFGMNGRVNVPISVAPLSGTRATTFTVTVASTPAPIGFQYFVEKKAPGGVFQKWLVVKTATVTFKPVITGTFSFRSSLQRVSNGAKSSPSLPKNITVS